MFRRFLNLGGRSEYAPAFGVRLSSAAFLPTLLPIEFLVIFETSAAPGFPAEARDSQFAQIRLPLANDTQNHARDRLRSCLPKCCRNR
jgi:hypothetical protein